MDNIVIDIQHLKKSFNGNDILRDINLQVKKGETVVTLGKSGSGKSVLLKCIVRLLFPDSGSVNVLGRDVLRLNDSELQKLRGQVGFIFQSGALYDSMTVRENLEFPLVRHFKLSKAEVGKKIHEALENVGLSEVIDKMPSELSGGMRKRVGLARTLILNPEIMLWDEPTTGLDPETSKEISGLILKMKEKFGVTSIVVTHDIPCAKMVADRMVVLKDGVYAEEGSYEQLEKSKDEFVRGFFEFN
jgi:phospholipid/cholesterol/gamma-HCH transport system ATP-binding protein